MSEYTFEFSAFANLPSFEQALQQIRSFLETGSTQLRSALQINPTFNPEALNQLTAELNATGDKAVQQAVRIGEQIGQSLSEGLTPTAASETLGGRLTASMSEALAEIRSQIAQFNASVQLAPGGEAAVLEFATSFQQQMLRAVQVVATDLRVQLNAAARDVGLEPRAVTGQFQGTNVTTASQRQLVGAVATPPLEDYRAQVILERGRQQATAEATQLTEAVSELLESIIAKVRAGEALTSAEANVLREEGLALDLRNPSNKRGIIAPGAPLAIQTSQAETPVVYRAQKVTDAEGKSTGESEFAPFSSEDESVILQYTRDVENATLVFQAQAAAVQRANEAEDALATAASKAAVEQEAAAAAATKRSELIAGLATGETTPIGSATNRRPAYRENATNQYFENTGVQVTDPGEVAVLDAQYIAAMRTAAAAATRESAAEQRASAAAEQRAVVQEEATAASRSGLVSRALGGATGVGFDAHAQFDPANAVGNLAGTAGVLLRYGAIGLGISAAFQGVAEVRKQIVDYQTSVVNLNEILASTGSEQTDFNGTIDAAAPAGIGAAQALDLAAEAAARYHDEIVAGADAGQVMQTSLANIGQAAILTGQDAKTAAQQLIDATQGFNIGATGQSRILDAVENARKNFGGDRSQILQAVGGAGDLAAQAGVDPEQLANIVALIQSRTGASGTAVASSFERTVSRQGTSSFQQALGGLGIQDTGNIITEISQLSQAYNGLTKTQQDALIAQLGGARQAKELLPLLQDGKELVDANTASYHGAGAAAAQYAAQQATLAGEIRQISGEFKDLAANLGQTGLFDALGPLIIGLKDVVQGVNELVSAFDLLPRPLRDVAFYALEALAAVRLFGSEETKVAVGTAVARVPVLGSFSRRIGLGPQTAEEEGSTGAAAALEEGATKAAATAVSAAEEAAAITIAAARSAAELQTGGAILGRGGGAAEEVVAGETANPALISPVPYGPLTREASLGAEDLGAGAALGVAGRSFAGLLANPVTLAIGGLVAIGGITNSMHQLNTAAAQGSLALNSLGRANDPQSLRTVADSLQSARDQLAKNSSGFFGTIAGFFSNPGAKENQYQSEATYARQAANRISAEQSTQVGLSQSVFGPSGDDISTGLATMAANSVDANTQLRAVAEALGLVKGAADGTAAGVLADVRRSQTQAPGLRYTQALLEQASVHQVGLEYTGEATPSLRNDVPHLPNPADVTKRAVDTLGKPTGGVLSPGDINKIADAYVSSITFTTNVDDPPDQGVRAKIRAAARQRILAYLQSLQEQKTQQQSGPLTNDALGNLLNGSSGKPGLLSVINSTTADPFDPTGGSSALRTNVQILQSVANRTGDKTGSHYPELIQAIHAAEDKLAQAQIADLERFRQAADARHSPLQDKKIDQNFFDREIEAAGADTNQLITVISNMTKSQIRLVEQMLKNQLAIAQAAQQSAFQLGAHLPVADRSAVVDAATGKVTDLQGRIAALNAAIPRAVPADASGAADSKKQAAQQAHLAEIEAGAIPGNDVQNAQVALAAANYQFSIAKKGSADYYNALKSVNDAKYQLSQAESQDAQAAVAATAYPNSQLQNARLQIVEAKDALSAAVPGTAAYFQALGQLNQAQIAYGDALIQYHSNERLLAGDPTDPVFTARNALRTARGQLRLDRRQGAPADVLTQDQLTVKQDKEAAQAAAFQQRFTDVQNLHDLGTLSDQAYLNYLQREHDRLSKIKEKTRQQTDELTQVDQAIHAAGQQLSGQFNIGDIHIPTPYEVRRYITAHAQGQNYDSEPVTHTHNNQVYNTVNNDNRKFDFKGLDRSQVEAIIRREMGNETIHRSGTASRKGI